MSGTHPSPSSLDVVEEGSAELLWRYAGKIPLKEDLQSLLQGRTLLEGKTNPW